MERAPGAPAANYKSLLVPRFCGRLPWSLFSLLSFFFLSFSSFFLSFLLNPPKTNTPNPMVTLRPESRTAEEYHRINSVYSLRQDLSGT